jgi:hypothetical protein
MICLTLTSTHTHTHTHTHAHGCAASTMCLSAAPSYAQRIDGSTHIVLFRGQQWINLFICGCNRQSTRKRLMRACELLSRQYSAGSCEWCILEGSISGLNPAQPHAYTRLGAEERQVSVVILEEKRALRQNVDRHHLHSVDDDLMASRDVSVWPCRSHRIFGITWFPICCHARAKCNCSTRVPRYTNRPCMHGVA